MKHKFIAATIVVFILLLQLPAAFTAQKQVVNGESVDISACAEGEKIFVAAGASVTIRGRQNNIQIICGEAVNLTLSDVVIDNGTHGISPLTFTGSATLSATGTNTLTGGVNCAGVNTANAVLTIGGSGILNANGGIYGAGIGGGDGQSGGTVTINGGTVCAIGGKDAAGIGGGRSGPGGGVTITGAVVTATGDGAGYDIGSGANNNSPGTLKIDNLADLTLAKNGTNASFTPVDCHVADHSAWSGTIADGYYINGVLFTGNAVDISINGYAGTRDDVLIFAGSKRDEMTIGVGPNQNYEVDIILYGIRIENSQSPAIIIESSAVNLILAGDNYISAGQNYAAIQINDGAKLTISGNGTLEAVGAMYCPGIGTKFYAKSLPYIKRSSITINGGNITTSGFVAPGIGNSTYGNNLCDITINAGNVRAYGELCAIGGPGSTTTVNGGVVYASISPYRFNDYAIGYSWATFTLSGTALVFLGTGTAQPITQTHVLKAVTDFSDGTCMEVTIPDNSLCVWMPAAPSAVSAAAPPLLGGIKGQTEAAESTRQLESKQTQIWAISAAVIISCVILVFVLVRTRVRSNR